MKILTYRENSRPSAPLPWCPDIGLNTTLPRIDHIFYSFNGRFPEPGGLTTISHGLPESNEGNPWSFTRRFYHGVVGPSPPANR